VDIERRRVVAGVVPLQDHLLALCLTGEGQKANRSLRSGRSGLQQNLQVGKGTCSGGGVEEVGIVAQYRARSRGIGAPGEDHLGRRQGGVAEDHGGLERLANGSGRGQGAVDGLAGPLQQRPETLARRHREPQREAPHRGRHGLLLQARQGEADR
jgi:hypothetical protein